MAGRTQSGETAKTLLLVGLILDGIGEVILLFVGFVFIFLLPFVFIGFLWIFLVYLFSYDRARDGDYEGARTPTLVFGILSLLSLAIVPGILFLVAYAKLGDAIQEEPSPVALWGQPSSPYAPQPLATTPMGSAARFCAHCGRAVAGPGRFCQGCGAPLG